jgi:hypothetical protein
VSLSDAKEIVWNGGKGAGIYFFLVGEVLNSFSWSFSLCLHRRKGKPSIFAIADGFNGDLFCAWWRDIHRHNGNVHSVSTDACFGIFIVVPKRPSGVLPLTLLAVKKIKCSALCCRVRSRTAFTKVPFDVLGVTTDHSHVSQDLVATTSGKTRHGWCVLCLCVHAGWSMLYTTILTPVAPSGILRVLPVGQSHTRRNCASG